MSEDQNETPKKKPRFVPPQPTEAQLAELEERHEDILKLNGPEMAPWCIVVRRPTRNETIMYKQHGRKEGQGVTANEALVRKIAVFPPVQDGSMDALLARWPFAPDAIVDNIRFKEFLGVTADADLKG